MTRLELKRFAVEYETVTLDAYQRLVAAPLEEDTKDALAYWTMISSQGAALSPADAERLNLILNRRRMIPPAAAEAVVRAAMASFGMGPEHLRYGALSPKH